VSVFTFANLVTSITDIDRAAVLAVGRQAQQVLSLRNWLIGTWIVTFEQDGADRAAYGDQLLVGLAESLTAAGTTGLSARNLRNCRQVALAFPTLDPRDLAVRSLAHPEALEIWQAPAKSLASVTLPDLPWRDPTWIRRLFSEMTFTHLVEFSRIDDATERAFYELHCLKERWSVRELVRQRGSLLYQRVGLSTERDAVLALAGAGRIDERPGALVRDPYVLEFLGLPSGPAVDESTLEQALIDNLQHFLLELGSDFCFVDRQYRITLGNRHFYLDLLFFHRRLRCLVAVELKTTDYLPDHDGQMRFYLNYLAKEVALPGENPPIGILLCAGKDESILQFAAVADQSIMVSRYVLELPKEAQLKQWLHEAREATEAQLRQTAPGEPRLASKKPRKKPGETSS
jgi:predicted nuclease of restriction endonuclease-like (RecB) superfamily